MEGNSIWKEIGRKYCYKEGNENKILFYLIISRNKAIFTQFWAKNVSHKCSPGASRTGPHNPYFEISAQPRTQAIISQTPLSVGRKDPRALLCVCPGERCNKQLCTLFSLLRQGSPQLLCFLSARGEDELILTSKIQSYPL